MSPTPHENLDTKARVGSLVGNTPHVLSHVILGELSATRTTPPGGEDRKPEPGLSWSRPHVPLPCADLNRCPFTRVNRNWGRIGVAVLREVFQPSTEPEGGLRDPETAVSTSQLTAPEVR